MQESINPSRLKTSLPRIEFCNREYLIDVEFHDDDDDIEIGRHAFHHCIALRGPIILLGVNVKVIEGSAFNNCTRLSDVEFG